MATVILDQHTLGTPFSGTQHNDNLQSIEDSLTDLGPYIISGLVPSATAGLAVDVTAGVANIGGRVEALSTFQISGLTDATLNHLYLLNTGAGASNTTGTPPASSVKLGTATTAAGVVSSVATDWASGRQELVRNEEEVHGGGAGHPRAVDLADWHLMNNEGNEVKGILPSGAIPAGAGGAESGTFAARPAAGSEGLTYYPTDGISVQRDNGTSWAPWGPIHPLTEPVFADFAWINQGGAVCDDTRGGNYLLAQAVAGANLRMRDKAAPGSTPYTIEGAFIPNIVGEETVFPGCGLYFRESSTSKIITWSYTTVNGRPICVPQKWTNPTTFSANYAPVWGGGLAGVSYISDYFTGSLVWYQIRNIGTHLQFWVSNDSRLWHQIYQEAIADFFTTGPNTVGFFANSNDAGYDCSMWLVHWRQA